jgi:hypothetical protein
MTVQGFKGGVCPQTIKTYWTYSVDGEDYYDHDFTSQAEADQSFLDKAPQGDQFNVETIEYYYLDGERVVLQKINEEICTEEGKWWIR